MLDLVFDFIPTGYPRARARSTAQLPAPRGPRHGARSRSAREESRHRGAGGRFPELLARRARAAGDGFPQGARRAAGRSRREQAALGDDGLHQAATARAHRSEGCEAVHDPAEGAPAARRNAAADHSGLPRRGRTVTDGTGKPDISTWEKTGHLYFGPTPAGRIGPSLTRRHSTAARGAALSYPRSVLKRPESLRG